jgi:hypothetical protein
MVPLGSFHGSPFLAASGDAQAVTLNVQPLVTLPCPARYAVVLNPDA